MMLPLTEEDQRIMDRWAFDPRYTNDVDDYFRSKRNTAKDMMNSTGIVGCVKHRIALAHADDAELIINPRRHDDPLFSPSRIAVY